jgi:hypothetical protein
MDDDAILGLTRALSRIEFKLDVLIKALAEEDDDQMELALDGTETGLARDATNPL